MMDEGQLTINQISESVENLRNELSKAIVGQDAVIEQVIIALLADGHALIEGVPGVAKTLIVRSLAHVLDLSFSRIQFTPDLMPSDITGTNVFDLTNNIFNLKKGPVFTNILLADEINRTPPKTQSALLEAMEERKVTIDGESHPLPYPFLVCATQNPIEFEGTYPLPEAQLDRFMLKIVIDYPTDSEEKMVLNKYHQGFRSQNLSESGLKPVLSRDAIHSIRKQIALIGVEAKVIDYIADLVRQTRNSQYISVGASPRAGIALLLCSKTLAAIRNRDFITPDDIREMALPVLRHRILLRPEAEIEGVTPDRVIQGILDNTTVPR